jgi:hypothetical protein
MITEPKKGFFYAPEDDGGGTGGDGNTGDGGTGAGSTGNQGAPSTDAEKRLAAMEEAMKKMQSSFDRKNTDFQKLQKENEELKKAAMDEAERRKYEEEQHKKELAERERAIQEKEFAIQKAQVMGEKGISPDLGKMISGNTIEEYQKNIDLVSSQIEEEVKRRVEKAIDEKLGGAPPPGGGGGGTPKGKAALIQQYNEAEKNGNVTLMMSLDQQIRNFKE